MKAKETNAIDYLEGLREGEKRGIRKAVGFIEEKWKLVNTEGQFPYFKFDYGDWQAFKKGIES